MAGTLNLSMSQQFDMDGEPLSGGLLYFFAAGTSTPQSAFQDFALTIVHPNPLTLDASGRVPQFFLADGFIKIRLTDKNGVTVIAADQLLVIGPSLGGSAGGGVDPNSVMQTGDIKARYGTGTLTGFLRCNGATFGNAASGATNASADNRPLFEYLYPFTVAPFNLTCTPRTGNAVNDFNGGSQMTLPDLRGRTIAGMDDMGAAAINRLTSTYFGAGTGASGIVLGNVGGDEKHALTIAELAQHNHGTSETSHKHTFGGTFTTGIQSADHTHATPPLNTSGAFAGGGLGGAVGYGTGTSAANPTGIQSPQDHTHSLTIGATDTSSTSTGLTVTNTGSSTAHAGVGPSMVLTFYIRL